MYAGRATMCLHTGMTDAYVWDLDTAQERTTGAAETRQILKEIDRVFRQDIGHLIYSHKVSFSSPLPIWHCHRADPWLPCAQTVTVSLLLRNLVEMLPDAHGLCVAVQQ